MKVDFNKVKSAYINNKEIIKIYHLNKVIFEKMQNSNSKENLIKTSTTGSLNNIGWIDKSTGDHFIGTYISINDNKKYLPKKDGKETTVVISEMDSEKFVFRSRRITGSYKPTGGTHYIDILFTEKSSDNDYSFEEL